MMQPKKLFVCAVLSKHQAPHPFPLDMEYYWRVRWHWSISHFPFDKLNEHTPCQSHCCELWVNFWPRPSSSICLRFNSFLQIRIWTKKVLPSHPVRLPVFVTHGRLCFSSRVSFFPLTSSLALVLSDHPRLPLSFSSSSFLLYLSR